MNSLFGYLKRASAKKIAEFILFGTESDNTETDSQLEKECFQAVDFQDKFMLTLLHDKTGESKEFNDYSALSFDVQMSYFRLGMKAGMQIATDLELGRL